MPATRGAPVDARPAPTAPTPFSIARGAAAAAGVTRLAEITGLDLVGIPVFQAIRPAGRSLSVHQGKG